MNKLRTILSLALVALMSVPAYGAEAMQVEQPQGMVAKSKQAVSNAKKRALKQFDESVDRFKRCIRGKCTKMEALKVARDVTIAAAATIAAMYVTGVAMEKGGKAAFDKVRTIISWTESGSISTSTALESSRRFRLRTASSWASDHRHGKNADDCD
jgi:hypothetical protein